MGQTLSHGVYLPNEGERNCYAGLASNWQILNTAVGAIAEKAPLVHTHTVSQITDFPAYGNAAGTICEGNDSRLSDARTPVAHTHTKSDVTDLFNSANTWTDTNTYTVTGDVPIRITNNKDATNPSATEMKDIRFSDVNGKIVGGVRHSLESGGTSKIHLYSRSFSLDGSSNSNHGLLIINNKQTGIREVQSESNFIPSANNSYDLGSSSYQWNNLYAKNYFYNGVAWGLDKQNEWTNFQRMTSNPAVWYLRNNTVTLGSAPSSNRYLGIFFEDVNGVELGNVHYQAAKNGYNSITFSLRNSDGTNTYTGALRYRASTTGDYCFFPETSECALGISTNQWKSVYAQSYYYNGVAWGLDKANVWTGRNQFNNLSLYSNDVTYNQAPSSNIELPSIRIMGGGRYCGAFDYVWRSTGENVIRLSLGSFTSAGSFGYWACNFGIPRDFSDGGKFGTPAFYPNTSGGYDLGTSTAKWKSLNGINPGALSLPKIVAKATANIASAIVGADNQQHLDGTDNNYTAALDGWISMCISGFTQSNELWITVYDMNNETWGTSAESSTRNTMFIIFPIRANQKMRIRMKCTSVDYARFYPCEGNV